MLATAPQHSSFFPGFPSRGALLPRSPHHFRLLGPKPTSAASSSSGSRSGRGRWKSKLCVAAGYKKVPMDTPGAYRLIDEETGEKVIVWGGSDDPDSPIPSKQVLSWKPWPRPPSREERPVEEVSDPTGVEVSAPVADYSIKPMGCVGNSVGNFGRLKVPKIKALIKKSTKLNKEGTHNNGESSVGDGLLDGVSHMDSEIRLSEGKSSLGVSRHREPSEDILSNEKIQGTYSSHLSSKEDLRGADVSMAVSRVASSLRRWSGSAGIRDSRVGQLKRHRNLPTDNGFFSRKSFKDLGCTDDMIESLRSQSFLRPSHIQAMAYGPVLGGKSCIIADQSGSGKTLAYLAPIIQCLRQEELLGMGKSSSKCPRVVILVPTAELASQVLNNCRSIAKFGVPFRSMVATGGFQQKTQLDNLQQEMDVLIATPGRFMFLLEEGFVQLTNLKCVVLDEVDILFGDESFEQVVQSLISTAPMSAQYLFVTATLPVDIYNKLVELFPDCEVLMGPGVHRTSSRLEEILVDCSGVDGEEKNPDTAFQNKKSALLQLVEESPVPKTIIFCNKIGTCRKVENVFKRFDRKGFRIKALPFHAALAQELRLSNMKEFLNTQSRDSLFLICTDRASRGIDFAHVDHVVLFDFPRDPSEYVRRVGRTARGAESKGKAFIFVVGKQVSLARRIMERNRKGHPLHDVPTAYELESSVL